MTRATIAQTLLMLFGVSAALAPAACGDLDGAQVNFRLQKGGCVPGCSSPTYTLTVLRAAGVGDCRIVSSDVQGSAGLLAALPLSAGDVVTVVISSSCSPPCAACYGSKEITVKGGDSHQIEMSQTIACIVPPLADPTISDCPGGR